MQGMEVNIHVSMPKFDLRLQDLRVVRLKRDDSDDAAIGTALRVSRRCNGLSAFNPMSTVERR